MEYNGIELDIEQIVSENESLRSQIIEANRSAFSAREYARGERIECEKLQTEILKKEAEIKRKLADAERIKHNILSGAGKIRMAAYNDAAKWNNAIAAKFDAMIKDASKTFLGRIIEKPIWERMKRRWMSKRLAKEY